MFLRKQSAAGLNSALKTYIFLLLLPIPTTFPVYKIPNDWYFKVYQILPSLENALQKFIEMENKR
jgi:hypothetical protein